MRNSRRRRVWICSLILFLSFECSTSFGTSPTDPTGTSTASEKLLALTEQRFHDLSPAERKLVEAAADGTDADCALQSDEDRVICAELLAWLCIDPDVSKLVTSRGISISGATIRGSIVLERANISFPLQIEYSVFEDSVNLLDAHLVYLSMRGSKVQGLSLDGAQIDRSVYLDRGFKSTGVVDLVATKIGGDLSCTGGSFNDQDGSFGATTPWGNFGGGIAALTDDISLNANRAEIKGSIFMQKPFTAQGEVNLVDATIGSNLDCSGGKFLGSGGKFVGSGDSAALDAGSAEIRGSVSIDDGFTAQGEVNLVGATIGSCLICTGGTFAGAVDQPALSANSADIKGAVFMDNGFTAQGEVNLENATIGSNLDCTGGKFVASEKSFALNAAGAKIQGDVLLNGDFDAKDVFSAKGGVRFTSAAIGGDLRCDRCRLAGGKQNPQALVAESAKIDGNVYFRLEALIDGDVDFKNTTIARDFNWATPKFRTHANLYLNDTKAGSVLMDLKKAPSSGYLDIDGFVYDYIDGLNSTNSGNPLRWIRLEAHAPRKISDQKVEEVVTKTLETTAPSPTPSHREYLFLPQRYEQLSSVLRKMGYPEDAVKVMVRKNEEAGDIALIEVWKATSKDFTKKRYLKVVADLLTGLWNISWYRFFGKFIGYGYTPWNALYASLAIVVVGYFVFRKGDATKTIIPKDDKVTEQQLGETYPKFNAFIYSLETFVPLVKLGLGDSWIPNAHGGRLLRIGIKSGSLLRYYFWFHIMAGWVLTTLWAASFTGLIKS